MTPFSQKDKNIAFILSVSEGHLKGVCVYVYLCVCEAADSTLHSVVAQTVKTGFYIFVFSETKTSGRTADPESVLTLINISD